MGDEPVLHEAPAEPQVDNRRSLPEDIRPSFWQRSKSLAILALAVVGAAVFGTMIGLAIHRATAPATTWTLHTFVTPAPTSSPPS